MGRCHGEWILFSVLRWNDLYDSQESNSKIPPHSQSRISFEYSTGMCGGVICPDLHPLLLCALCHVTLQVVPLKVERTSLSLFSGLDHLMYFGQCMWAEITVWHFSALPLFFCQSAIVTEQLPSRSCFLLSTWAPEYAHVKETKAQLIYNTDPSSVGCATWTAFHQSPV